MEIKLDLDKARIINKEILSKINFDDLRFLMEFMSNVHELYDAANEEQNHMDPLHLTLTQAILSEIALEFCHITGLVYRDEEKAKSKSLKVFDQLKQHLISEFNYNYTNLETEIPKLHTIKT